MPIAKPFNLTAWIEENRDLLKPPVGNKNLYVESGDYIVMIVAGPNARKDYHYNETEELFFQIEGDILVKTQQDGKVVDIPVKEGEMFLSPAKIPHSPVRSEGSIGLVIERKRSDTDTRMDCSGFQTKRTPCCMRNTSILRTLKKIFFQSSKNSIPVRN